jgi:hypothetical protein
VAKSTRPRFREAHARDLGIGKHDGGHGGAVVTPAVAVQGVPGGELGAVGCHVDKLIPPRHVAGRVDTCT